MVQSFLCDGFFSPSRDTDPVVYSGLKPNISGPEFPSQLPSYWLKRKCMALIFINKIQDILD